MYCLLLLLAVRPPLPPTLLHHSTHLGPAATSARPQQQRPQTPPFSPLLPPPHPLSLLLSPPSRSTEGARRKPPIYHVMLHNDNYNRREYVVKVLLKVVEGYNVDKALQCMQVGVVLCRGLGGRVWRRQVVGGSSRRRLHEL